MEILFEIIAGFLLELLIPILIELSLLFGLKSVASSTKEHKEVNKFLAWSGCFILGLIAGCFSVWVYPKHIFSANPLPGIGLVTAPIAAGYVMKRIGEMRLNAGKGSSTLTTFWGGALFAFAYSLWRFIYAG